jgi:hypothetical protein
LAGVKYALATRWMSAAVVRMKMSSSPSALETSSWITAAWASCVAFSCTVSRAVM